MRTPNRCPLIAKWTPMRSKTEGTTEREAERRRRFSKEFKRQVVEETLAGDASMAGVALRHRLNANLVFTWRRKYLRALASTQAKPVTMLPVAITDCNAAVPAMGCVSLPSACSSGAALKDWTTRSSNWGDASKSCRWRQHR